MDFCTKCGSKSSMNSLHCQNCGEKLREQVEQPFLKPPNARKQKITQRIMVGLAVLVVGFSIWATNHHSAESVQNRFQAAIDSQNERKIMKLALHEDHTSIAQYEAKALLTLAEANEKSSIHALSTVVQQPRFLGIFKNYKIQLVDQYIVYGDMMDGLSFEFNEQQVPEEYLSDEKIRFGPISPGIYAVQIDFEGEYGTGSYTETIEAADIFSNDQWFNADLPIANVTFKIDPFDSEKMTKAFILLDGEEFAVDEYGETKAIGPMFIDGSQHVTATVTSPWGTTESSKIPIDGSYIYVIPTVLSEEQVTKMVDLIANYGESYAEYHVLRDPSRAPVDSEVFNRGLNQKLHWMIENDEFASMELTLVEVDSKSLHFVNVGKDFGFQVIAQLRFNAAYYALDEKPKFEEQIDTILFTFLFDEGKKAWHIKEVDYGEVQYNESTEFVATNKQKGSGKLHEPSKESLTKKKDENYEQDIPQFMTDFHDISVVAINNGDISYSQHFYTEDGPSLKESKDYIPYLVKKGITEEHLQTTVEHIEKVDETTFKVTSIDQYIIIKDGEGDKKTYQTVSLLKVVDGELRMQELISTEEI